MSKQAHRTLIKGAQIMTMDETLGDLDAADILVEGTDIIEISPSITADADETIDASGMVVIPGLIDAHSHIWETLLRGMGGGLWLDGYFKHILPRRKFYRHEDMYNAGFAAGHEMLAHGTTTILDYCHNLFRRGSARAAIDGLADTGIRTLFGYNVRIYPGEEFKSREEKFAEARDVFAEYHKPGGMTGLVIAANEPFAASMETIAEDFAFARELGVPITFHSIFSSHITGLKKANLLGPDVMAVHCNVLTDDELDMMAEAGSSICFTPSIDVYGTPADIVGRARKRGVGITWGCDVPPKLRQDLLLQMNVMYHVQGYIDGVLERSEGRAMNGRRPPARAGLPSLTPRGALSIATIETARILGMDQWIGSLKPGKRADMVMINKGDFGWSLGDPAEYVLMHAGSRDIDTVMVNGAFRKRGGRLVDFDAAGMLARVNASREHILGQKVDMSVAYEVKGGGEFFDGFEG